MRGRSGALLRVLGAVWWLALAGCQRGDPQLALVEAHNVRALDLWRVKARTRYTQEQWKEFDAALQEVRLKVMADREATGKEAIEEAMCARINGHPYRDVLALGYEAKLSRLWPTQDELRKAIDGNMQLVTKPGDTAGARYLESLRERQEERLRKVDTEIAATEARMKELGKTLPARVAKEGGIEGPSGPQTRESVLANVRQLIQSQRDAAVFKYGPWPLKIDREGKELTGEDKRDFEAKRSVAGKERVVIPVRHRDRWWIYDARAESPIFSKAMQALLTDEDRKDIDQRWWTMQAEVWARKSAFDEANSEAERAKADGLAPAAAPKEDRPPVKL